MHGESSGWIGPAGDRSPTALRECENSRSLGCVPPPGSFRLRPAVRPPRLDRVAARRKLTAPAAQERVAPPKSTRQFALSGWQRPETAPLVSTNISPERLR